MNDDGDNTNVISFQPKYLNAHGELLAVLGTIRAASEFARSIGGEPIEILIMALAEEGIDRAAWEEENGEEER